MEALDIRYKTVLDDIKVAIQNSEQLTNYLDEEEFEQYKLLIDAFEPQIHELYEKVASTDPLQLISLEEYLLDNEFEGLYLPKVLGYSVLRGRINDDSLRYDKPQDHFKKVLLYIANSSNFEQIRSRAGQSIQMGFALSSDIWITNLIDQVVNKKVKQFLRTQKVDAYRQHQIRKTALVKYRKQFQSLNYSCADFPVSKHELVLDNKSLQKFLNYRSSKSFDNSSLDSHIVDFIGNEDLHTEQAFAENLIIIARSYSNGKVDKIKSVFDKLRNGNSQFSDWYFKHLNTYLNDPDLFSTANEKSIASTISRDISDELTPYYNLMDVLLSRGFVAEETIDLVREYYFSNEGLSDQNSCLRSVVLNNLSGFLNNLPEEEYQEYFEINKTFSAYMDIFSNQKFNQDLKYLSLKYVKKLKAKYTDKRGKDYQDIKKFVMTTFQDLGFMTEKEIVELFKTRRKKKVTA